MPPPPGTNTPLSNELCAAALTREEVGLVEALLGRVAKLAAAAAEKGVRLMIDAEHTYFQPVRRVPKNNIAWGNGRGHSMATQGISVAFTLC